MNLIINKRTLFLFFVFVLSVVCLTARVSRGESLRETPIVKVVEQNAQAVVNISTEHVILLRENPYWGNYGSQFDMLFDQFFGMQRARALKLKSVGSGVVVDEQGLIVTNAHVVHMASNIIVIFKDGTKKEGRIVYENPKKDLAIIKVAVDNPIAAVSLADDDDILVGETVVAIGNPLGLENSVSAGIISGIDRKAFSERGLISSELIQTDAPINPGNSGGALINLDGNLVGINVAVVQNSQSIGFAIPVKRVKEAIENHEQNKELVITNNRQDAEDSQSIMPSASRPPLAPWDPFDEMRQMREEIDRMFTRSFQSRKNQGAGGMFNSSIFFDQDFNIKEEPDKYVIKVEVGDINKDNIDVEINEQSITIKGEYSAQTEETGPNRSFSSRSLGSFLKTIPLPDNADTERIETEVVENAIIITLPKKS